MARKKWNLFAVGFYPPRPGGSGQAGWRVAKELAGMGHKITVFSEKMPGCKVDKVHNMRSVLVPTRRQLMPSVRDYRLASPLRRVFGLGGGIARKPFTDAITRELKEVRPDAILVNFAAPIASFVQGLARRRKIPVIIVFHGSDVHNLTQPEYMKVKKPLLKSYQESDARIAVSNDLKNILEKEGIRGITVIPNAVDRAQFRPLPPKEVAGVRRGLGIPQDAVLLAHVSTLRPIKRPLDIVEAAAKALRISPNLHFLVVGEGPLGHKMLERAKELGIGNKFVFTGKANQKNVNRYLNASDALVMPSEREGMPLVILEAAACGKPTIASSVGGMPEIVRDGRNGLLFEMGNVERLAEKMAAISDPSFRRRLSIGAAALGKKADITLAARKYAGVIRAGIARKNAKRKKPLGARKHQRML